MMKHYYTMEFLGESLGTDRLKVIKEIADKAGWQIIMEQVERGTKKLHLEIMAD